MTSNSNSDSEQEKTMPKKYKHREVHTLNPYNRRILFQTISEHGCTEKNFESIKNRFKKLKPGEIEDYINGTAYDAQMKINTECDLPMFQSLNIWANYFKEFGLNEECNNDLVLAFKLIAEMESHPSPEEVEGIDFCHLYTFLSDVMKGNPTIPLNKPTTIFLTEIFKELEAAIQSSEGTKARKKLEETISENSNIITIVESRKEFPRHLDPLNVEITQ